MFMNASVLQVVHGCAAKEDNSVRQLLREILSAMALPRGHRGSLDFESAARGSSFSSLISQPGDPRRRCHLSFSSCGAKQLLVGGGAGSGGLSANGSAGISA